MKVIVDESAWSDLAGIASWIARDNLAAARQEVEKIRHSIGQIADFPGLSRDGRVKGTRERVMAGTNYIVVFEVLEQQRVLIVTGVVHGARNRP